MNRKTPTPKPTLYQGLSRGMKAVFLFNAVILAFALLAAIAWPDLVWQGEPEPVPYFITWGLFCLALDLACLTGNYLSWRKEAGRVR